MCTQECKREGSFGIGALCGFFLCLFLCMCFAAPIFSSLLRMIPSEPSKDGLVYVTILEKKYDKNAWWLLETGDGQRVYIECYRGQVGEKFKIHQSNLKGYYPPKLNPEKEQQDVLNEIKLNTKEINK